MNRKRATTVLALAVLGPLGAYGIFVGLSRQKPAGPERVFTTDPARAREIVLTRAGGRRVRIFRDGSVWRLAEPQSADADGAVVESLLSSLASLEAGAAEETASATDAELGLDPPRLKVSLLADGVTQPQELLVGTPTTDGRGLYARRGTRPAVFVVPPALERILDRRAFDFRERRLVRFAPAEVQGLHVTGPAGTWSLRRAPSGGWAFTRPLTTRADAAVVDRFLVALEELRMESVAAEQARGLEAYGLHAPTHVIQLDLPGGTTHRLELGGAAGDRAAHNGGWVRTYYARDAERGLVAVVSDVLVRQVAAGLDAWRDKRLLAVTADAVAKIEVFLAGEHKSLDRSAEVWRSGDGPVVDAEAVEDALFFAGTVEAERLLEAEQARPRGLDRPSLRVLLQLRAGGDPVGFRLTRARDGAWAERTDDGAVLWIPLAPADEVLKRFKDL